MLSKRGFGASNALGSERGYLSNRLDQLRIQLFSDFVLFALPFLYAVRIGRNFRSSSEP